MFFYVNELKNKDSRGCRVPNNKTMKAIRNSRAGKGRRFSTAEALFKDLGI